MQEKEKLVKQLDDAKKKIASKNEHIQFAQTDVKRPRKERDGAAKVNLGNRYQLGGEYISHKFS